MPQRGLIDSERKRTGWLHTGNSKRILGT